MTENYGGYKEDSVEGLHIQAFFGYNKSVQAY
jgi:hypothetical protein